MASILTDCPHCGGIKIGFSGVAEYKLAPHDSNKYLLFMVCNNCQGAIVNGYHLYNNMGYTSPASCPGDPANFGFNSGGSYPTPAPSKVPPQVPAPIDSYFLQASDALKRGHYDASGAMSRKVVDVSTQQLLGDESKKYNNIKSRIDALMKNSTITPDLGEWAHEVRLGGNDAAHDEDPYQKPEAEELLDFAELYLTYVYTLPKRLEGRKAKAAAAKGGG
jgi:Domain of unknown function (DUF4145)